MIMWLKENGYKWYDLGGINPEENPGTYQFKRGLSGALGQNQTKIGQYDFYNNHRANLLSKLIRGIILLRRRIHAMRSSLIKSYKPFLKVLTIGRR
jgi:lipid II:glycine glycyltransferase (peptidoglycan interpeptide bridge formation enzyme)